MALNVDLRPSRDFFSPQVAYLPQHTENRLRTTLRTLRLNITEAIAPIIHPHEKVEEFKEAYGDTRLPRRLQGIFHPVQTLRTNHEHAYAERATNEFYAKLKHSSGYGEQFHHAMTDVWHHGFPHRKRLSAFTRISQNHTSEIHLPQFVQIARIRFAGEHDVNQVIADYRIQKEYLKGTVDAKYGHGLGGAVVALATAKEYATATNISEKESLKIAKTLALMILCHDKPDKLPEALGIRGPMQYQAERVRDISKFDGIRQTFSANRLDIFSLSPRDILELLSEEKANKGFDTNFGISPTFEKQFIHELTLLAQDTTPLGVDFSEKEKEAIKNAALLATIPDVFDMLIPSEEALLRMFTVPRSMMQPLAWIYTNQKDEETILKETLSGNGTTDVQRKLFEAATLLTNLIRDTKLEKNVFIRNIVEDYSGYTFAYLKQTIPLFMRGDKNEIEKYIQGVFDKRRGAIVGKVKNDSQLSVLMEKLQLEEQQVIDALSSKPNGIYHYAKEDIDSFLRVAEAVELSYWVEEQKRHGRRTKNEEMLVAGAKKKVAEYAQKYEIGQTPLTATKKYDRTSGNPGKRLFSI